MSPKVWLICILFTLTTPVFSLPNEYITAPKLIQPKNLSTRISKFFLNGIQIDHTKNGQINLGMLYGDSLQVNSIYAGNRHENLHLDAFYTLNSQVKQSLSTTQIFNSDQQGAYFQFKTITNNQQIVLTKSAPQTMQGMQMQMSFTGACSNLENANYTGDPDQQCTFTPSLLVDKNSIDPEFFIPTQIQQFNDLGTPISNATAKILTQPGFQSVGANGQIVGLDIYTPNIGATPGSTQSDTSQISRQNRIKTIPLLGYSRVRKVIQANHTEAVIGLTIHGFGGVWDTDNAEINFSLSAGAQLLPDVVPELVGSDNKVKTNINNNLWNAAANIRLPENSWTIYQASIGRAKHPEIKNGVLEIPNAHFHSLWLGLSPVRHVTINSNFAYIATSDVKNSSVIGSEGGNQNNISFVSSSNQGNINSKFINDDYYIQAYLTRFDREVNLVSTTKINYQTTYYPHLSYSGNLTGSDFVARYYAGLLVANNFRTYFGADYTQKFWQHWKIHAAAIIYPQHSDRDYFSRLDSSITRKFNLWDTTNITVFSSTRYALNRPGDNNFLNDPIDNFINLGLSLNIEDWLQVTAAYNLGDILPISVPNSLSASGQINLNQYVAFGAFLSPYSNQKTYGAFINLNNQAKPGVNLKLGWQHRKINYGDDPFEHQLTTENDFWSANISFNW